MSLRFVVSLPGFARSRWGLLGLNLFLLVGLSKAQSNDDCMQCHADRSLVVQDTLGKTRSLYVDLNLLKSSTHGKLECVSCHSGIKELPHSEKLPAVNCGTCHSAQTEVYQWHGREKLGVHPHLPTCQSSP